MRYIVETTFYVSFYDPEVFSLFVTETLYLVDCRHCRASGSKTVRARQKMTLVNWLHDHFQSLLHHPISDGGYPEWPQFPVGFWDVNPPRWHGFIRSFSYLFNGLVENG